MIVVKILIIIVCVTYFFYFIRDAYQGIRSLSWPKAIGTITNTWITEMEPDDGFYNYRPEISYEYIVDGRTYKSNRFAYLSRHGSVTKEKAAAKLDVYAVGKDVQVFYSHKNPELSVLEPGFRPSYSSLLWLGLFIILFIGMIVIR